MQPIFRLALGAGLALGLVAGLAGCGSASLTLVNTLARLGAYDVERDIAYGEAPDQRLDVYKPRGVERAPIVVFFYGGGWKTGHKRDYIFAAQALTSRGFIAVVPDYRKYPEVRFPSFVRDAAASVAWAHAEAARLGGDPQDVFVMGHSAGAHIAALLTLDARYLEEVGGKQDWIRGMVGLAGPYDFNARRADLRAIFAGGPYEATQPLTFAGRSRAPLFLLHGLSDQTVFKKNTVNLAGAVKAAGGDVRVKLYEDLDHAGLLATFSIPLRSGSSVLEDVASFVREVAESG